MYRSCTSWGARARGVLVSVAALSLLGGVVYAQDTSPASPGTARSNAVLRAGDAQGKGGVVTGGVGVICTQTVPGTGCQLPDQMGHGAAGTVAATSDVDSGFSVAENFSPAVGGTITDICWWGIYVDFPATDCAPGPGSTFTITYFNDAPSAPQSVPGTLFSGPFTVTATKAPTGNFIGGILAAEFEFTATHPPVTVVAGQCYWIEIVDASPDPVCVWLWETAPPGDGISAQDINGDGVYDPASEGNDFDHAFCVNVTLGNPKDCIPLVCGDPASGPCDIANGSPGCDDQACCNAVCAVDAFCCDVEWDINCAGSAEVLCAVIACGGAGTGGCFDANGTPFCDDTCGVDPCTGCCDLVCALDPFCCDTSWDGLCAGEAMDFCLACGPGDTPANDECVDAEVIALGTINVTNTCATPEAPDHVTCNDGFVTGLGAAVWYRHTPASDGLLNILPAVVAGWTTQLAVYDTSVGDCGLLQDPPAACAPLGGGINVAVTAGVDILIRLGGTFDGPSGTGTLTLSAVPDACVNGVGDCLAPHGGLGCADSDCCTVVCALDPTCCSDTWDQLCADSAKVDCAPLPCGLDTTGNTLVEPEVCGTDLNGGCNTDPPPAVFTNVSPGEIVHGTAWADLGTRDTDWYLLDNADLTAADTNGNGMVEISYSPQSETPVVSFLIVDVTGDCVTTDTGQGSIGYGQSCVNIATGSGVITIDLASRYIVFAGTGTETGGGIFDGYPCDGATGFGSDYLLTIEVTDDALPCPWDCQPVPDGVVSTPDLLALLGQWLGPGSCEFSGDGFVSTPDLLKMLGFWGPCP